MERFVQDTLASDDRTQTSRLHDLHKEVLFTRAFLTNVQQEFLESDNEQLIYHQKLVNIFFDQGVTNLLFIIKLRSDHRKRSALLNLKYKIDTLFYNELQAESNRKEENENSNAKTN